MKLVIVTFIIITSFSCRQAGKVNSTSTISEKDSINISNYVAGKMLFANNCAACHAINKHADPQMLVGIEERWKSKALLYAFIRNPQAVIAKDAYAKNMYEEYSKIALPGFPNLSDEQIEQVLLYINISMH